MNAPTQAVQNIVLSWPFFLDLLTTAYLLKAKTFAWLWAGMLSNYCFDLDLGLA